MDLSTKKSLPLKWQPKLSHHFLIVQFFFNVFHSNLGCMIVIKCKSVNQKIMPIEMVTKIKSPCFNNSKFFKSFFALMIEFRLLDYNQGVDKLTKKSWLLKWRPKFGPNCFSVFLPHWQLLLGRQIMTKV